MIADGKSQRRDLRVDFLRGSALLVIFIDHIPQSHLARFTPHSFGLSDAAEMFVVLAGYSAVLAYGRALEQPTGTDGLVRIGARIGTIYAYNMATLAVGVSLALLAAKLTGRSQFLQASGLSQLVDHPAWALPAAATLLLQPDFFDILPLYIVLLACFPIIHAVLSRNLAAGVGLSVLVWLMANLFLLNLPTVDQKGWYFNPVAWQLLLVLGAAASIAVKRKSLPVSRVAMAASGLYCLFAFVFLAPWKHLPGLEDVVVIDPLLFGKTIDKTYLSPWRLLHIVSVGYLVLVLVPARAAWLKTPAARLVSAAGRHSLEIFCLGALLSISAGLILEQADNALATELLVTVTGIGFLLLTGAWLERRRHQRRTRARSAGPAVVPASSMMPP